VEADERRQFRAELDAAYFLLYGVARDDVEYILSTFPAASQADDETPLYADEGSVLAAYDRLGGVEG